MRSAIEQGGWAVVGARTGGGGGGANPYHSFRQCSGWEMRVRGVRSHAQIEHEGVSVPAEARSSGRTGKGRA